MDNAVDKFKHFVKSTNKKLTSSSSSTKFKGTGRVLGSSSSSPPSNPVPRTVLDSTSSRTHAIPTDSASMRKLPETNHKSVPVDSQQDEELKQHSSPIMPKSDLSLPSSVGGNSLSGTFSPFEPLVSSSRRNNNRTPTNSYECPVCLNLYSSLEEVTEHVDACLNSQIERMDATSKNTDEQAAAEFRSELVDRIANFFSGKPPSGSIDIIQRLIRNILSDSLNPKFLRIRMSNPKIKEAIAEVSGGIELLQAVGFQLQEEGEEKWATMEAPSDEQLLLMKEAINLMQQRSSTHLTLVGNHPEKPLKPDKMLDRQVRVFICGPGNVAAKINLPDSFYNLTSEELKREAALRKKKIEESQLLIPKSFKEKKAMAARKCKVTVIRIQFPDGVIIQGLFYPWEPTTFLFEFVHMALKEPSLEFSLLLPSLPKWRIISAFPEPGGRQATLEEEDLVPTARLIFRPNETDSIVYTGIRMELLEAGQPTPC